MPCQCQEVHIKFQCDHEQDMGIQTQCELAEESNEECPDPTIQVIPDPNLCMDCADAFTDETTNALLESTRAEHEAFLRSTGAAVTDEDEEEMMLKAMRESSLHARENESQMMRAAIEASMRALNPGDIGDYLSPEMFERSGGGRTGRRPDGSINPQASGSGSGSGAGGAPLTPAPAPEPVVDEAEDGQVADEEEVEEGQGEGEDEDEIPSRPEADLTKPTLERMIFYTSCKHWLVVDSQMARTEKTPAVIQMQMDGFCPKCKGKGAAGGCSM
ncbi:hypothetical protein BT63DRAFT_459961 [Microthyrium microscopicum]|uniref:Uncharacterized protein n=1 Tax=Microthyrium microscopicum TaxID=703497 RepID=A0A6A6TXD5_9PEZI|nr:hypothetical protein BT63DRAFT_459961 [Microthyrium microscopicum]